MRRKDRAVTDESWIIRFLQTAPYGALATVHGDQPFINSNLFVYNVDKHVIYVHTAHVGRTVANVATHDETAPVCFSVFNMGRLLPAERALEFSTEYEGVVVFGKATIVQDRNEAAEALQLLLDKYAPHLKPGRDYRPITDDELKRTSVFRISISSWTGKKKAVEANFEGAYRFEDILTQAETSA
ncbi:MAG: pyridoxamine 5'-phosphate oxidase family protein [Rubricoccaceae bacterium]|nr:pyridoxamine 5'-phosphate oxidase family protein [Rubricoccaceae bacterium]